MPSPGYFSHYRGLVASRTPVELERKTADRHGHACTSAAPRHAGLGVLGVHARLVCRHLAGLIAFVRNSGEADFAAACSNDDFQPPISFPPESPDADYHGIRARYRPGKSAKNHRLMQALAQMAQSWWLGSFSNVGTVLIRQPSCRAGTICAVVALWGSTMMSAQSASATGGLVEGAAPARAAFFVR